MSEENKTFELKDKELKKVTDGTGGNVNGVDGSGTINITIKDMHNKKSYFTVAPEITVYDLKSLYAEREAYGVEMCRFVYKGNVLDNSRTLASYNISNDTVIHVTFY